MKKIILFANLFFLFVVSTVAAIHEVTMSPTAFDPPTSSINVGDTVVWNNTDTQLHTSTSTSTSGGCSPNGTWDSNTMNPGDKFSHVFSAAGSFHYYCDFHCTMGMTGTITVTDVGTTGTKNALTLNLNVKSFPNPFTESATVEFELAKSGSVMVELYNMQGQKIITPLVESSLGSGKHSIVIPASELKAGLYVCKLFLNGAHAGSNYMVKSQ